MIKVMIISFWTNLILTVAKILMGFLGHSSALIADGISSASDMITDIFAIMGGILSKKRANKSHPIGYGKFENIVSFIIGIIIVFLSFLIMINITLEEIVIPNPIILIFIFIAIVIKLFLVKFLTSKALIYNSELISAAKSESKVDLYGTILVFISTILMLFSDKVEVFKYANLATTIIIALLILKTGIHILLLNLNELSEKSFTGSLNKEVKEIILGFKDVEKIEKLYLFKIGSYYELLSEIILKRDLKISEAQKLREDIEDILKDKKIKYVYIEMSK